MVRTFSSSELNTFGSLPVWLRNHLSGSCASHEVPLHPDDDGNEATFQMPFDPIGVLDEALSFLKDNEHYYDPQLLCFFYDIHRSEKEHSVKLCWCRFDPDDPDEASTGFGVIYEVHKPTTLLQAALDAMMAVSRWKPEVYEV